MPTSNLGQFSGFVSDIYDCAVDEALWGPTLERLRRSMGGVYMTLEMGQRDQGWALQYTSDFDRDILAAATKYIPNVPGVSGVISASVDMPFSTLSNMSEEEAHKTAFYREWALPNGLRDGAVVKYIDNAEMIGTMSFVTGFDREPITEGERDVLRLLAPHFRRAMMISDSIQRRQVHPDSYRASLEALTLPILIAGGQGELRFVNGAAEVLLAASRLLRLRHGVLEPVAEEARPAFAEALACAASSDALLGRRGVGLRLPDVEGAAQYAYILPIGRTQARTFGGPGAAIFLTASARQRPPPVAVLMTMLDIDLEEAQVLLAVCDGRSAEEAAEALGIAPGRTTAALNGLYVKLGVTRPAELTRIVRALALPEAIDPSDLPLALVR